LPNGLEDAALIDGCGPFRCYFKVMLPNAVTSIVTDKHGSRRAVSCLLKTDLTVAGAAISIIFTHLKM